jgi:putative acetyltransferase
MPAHLAICAAAPADAAAVRQVHEAAFGQRDEADLVERLVKDGHAVVSMVAAIDGDIVGHVLLSRLSVGGEPALALAPVGVIPDRQRHGIGGALIRSAIGAAEAAGERLVVVLGEPAYYRRFGFEPAADRGVTARWEGPALQVLTLPAYDGRPRGEAVYPSAFDEL